MKCDYDRMFCYLWHEDDKECKFGERWVPTNKDDEQECRKRVRESLGVRKDKFDEETVQIDAIWDVTDIAKKIDRFKKGGRVDDYLREKIGFRKGSTGEIHALPAPEMKIKVNELLHKLGQPLIKAGLSTYQYKVAEELIEKFKLDNKVILTELCPRFGKTIWSSAIAVEMEVDIVIVASYVKTVFTSFATDITSFEQFVDYEHIDLGKDDYKDKFKKARKNNKKVFLYLSLCQGSKRQERINWVANIKGTKMLIVDEADFGAHREKQAIPLINKLHKINHVIIMTGTNADRAASKWPIDHITSVTYPELVMQKRSVLS